jgi:hypothetical protein
LEGVDNYVYDTDFYYFNGYSLHGRSHLPIFNEL